MRKTIEELKKLSTQRLLQYYKVERKKFYSSGYWCDCGCGDSYNYNMCVDICFITVANKTSF